MKKLLKIILPIVLVLAILVSIGWYFLQYDKEFTRDVLLSWARDLDDAGNYDMADWFYNLAYRQAGNDDTIAIEVARQYKERGNYTQAENTLTDAISDGGSIELYIELCKTYIEQDKLLDAVNMLDRIPDPAVKEKITSMRPAIPAVNYPSGNYNEYISLSFSAPDGKVYANFNNEYPSVRKNLFSKPVTLADGATTIQTVCVSSNGLVSPLQIYSYTVSQVSKAITLSDPAIDRTVREMLNVDETYELSTDDLLNFEAFMVPDDAASLEDLYYMPHLKALVIRDCVLENLNPVGYLKELEDLTIQNVTLSSQDVETISSLTTLKYLTANSCGLSNVKSFGNLTNLEYLDLNNNAIGDITLLQTLPGLTYLDMSHNALTSLDGIQALEKLIELNVSYNSLTSLSALSTCANLRALDASSNALTSLTGLEGTKKLGVLYVSSNKLKDISALAGMTDLADLDLSRNKLTNLSALSNLPNLYMLNFSHNQVTKLPEFQEGAILGQINGAYNKLSTLKPLAGLTMLTHVGMSYNASITSIDALITCESLVQIDVLNTGVRNVSAFKGKDIQILYNLS